MESIAVLKILSVISVSRTDLHKADKRHKTQKFSTVAIYQSESNNKKLF